MASAYTFETVSGPLSDDDGDEEDDSSLRQSSFFNSAQLQSSFSDNDEVWFEHVSTEGPDAGKVYYNQPKTGQVVWTRPEEGAEIRKEGEREGEGGGKSKGSGNDDNDIENPPEKARRCASSGAVYAIYEPEYPVVFVYSTVLICLVVMLLELYVNGMDRDLKTDPCPLKVSHVQKGTPHSHRTAASGACGSSPS